MKYQIFLGGFLFNSKNNYRDVCLIGDCQEKILLFAEEIGWKVIIHYSLLL